MHTFAALYTITFENVDIGRSFSHIWYDFRGYRFSSYMKIKVTGAKKIENSYFHNVKL